jgi:ribonuclease BN (tRNA processing enzyme)
MKLTVLGNRSPYPIKEGPCSGYLVQTERNNILLDIGSGVLGNLDQVLNYQELDAVIITHLHEDHWLDLYPLHYALGASLSQNKRQEALAVYLPFSEGVELEYIRRKTGDEYHFQPIDEKTELDFNSVAVTFKQTDHSKECYAVRIESNDEVIGYSADGAYQTKIADFLSGADMSLIEASLLEKDKKEEIKHMTVEEAVRLGTEAEVGRVLLTHLGSLYTREKIAAEIPETGVEVEISRVLKTYQT